MLKQIFDFSGRVIKAPVITILLLALLVPINVSHQRVTAEQNQPAPNKQTDEADVKNIASKASLFFEANKGQHDKRVKFSASGSGYKLFLTSTEAVYVIPERKAVEAQDPKTKYELPSTHTPKSSRAVAVWMKLAGANQNAEARGVDELAGKHNYFKGSDQSKWQSNVPLYQKARFDNVYPGVGLEWHRNETGSIEYDFKVSPFVSTRQIEWRIDGADKVTVEDDGSLLISTPFGELKQNAPVTYQETDGLRSAVQSRFEQRGETSVGFTVGAYDESKPLTIDPVTDLNYSTFLGGEADDSGKAIAVGGNNVYVTGSTASMTFPVTIGVFDPDNSGGEDVFVTKLNDDASALVYSTYIGGGGDDVGFGIAVDTSGNAYITGRTGVSTTPYPTTINAPFPNHSGGIDAFVTKLNATGSALLHSTFIGGSGNDEGHAIAVRSSNAYITGSTNSPDYPTTGAFDNTYNGGQSDILVTKLAGNGASLDYSTFIGGVGVDDGTGIAVDTAGNAFVCGMTNSNYPTTPAAFDITFNGNFDAVVTKLNADGSDLIYSTFLGGNNQDPAYAIAIDSSGSAYITGNTNSASNSFPTTVGAFDTTRNGFNDVFVTKFNPAGSTLVYSTFIGGNSTSIGWGIDVNAAGNAFVTGYVESGSIPYPTTAGAFDTTHNGDIDAFLTKLTASGSVLIYSTFIGGQRWDEGFGIALNSSGDAFMTGGTYDGFVDFPTTAGVFQPNINGGNDAFVCKFLTPRSTVVTNTNDNGAGSLRQAVNDANTLAGDDIIEFSSLFSAPQTILLSTGEIELSSNITIHGTGANLLTVRNTAAQSATSRVFHGAGGTVYLNGLTITGGNVSGNGGGILKDGNGSMTLDKCTVSDNIGGGIVSSREVSILNSTFSGNSDGGITHSHGALTVTNSTISGNTRFGIHIFNGVNPGTLTLTNSTITNNSGGTSFLAGVYPSNGTVTFRNSIVAGNQQDIGGSISSFVSNGYNLIGNVLNVTAFNQPGDQTGTPAQPLNPRLAPLAFNGGTTQTHELLPISPAIDKGSNFDVYNDQRGLMRPFDNNRVANLTDGSDIGAFERQDHANPFKAPFDFDGDGKADISVFRPSSAVWYLSQSQAGYTGVAFGANGDLISPADFDGDGKTDIGLFRPSNGTWYRLNSSTGAFYYEQFGANGDLPVPADFDGDGKADLAIYRPSSGEWYWLNSGSGVMTGVQFGISGDKPAMGDFDGDGKADVSLFRASNGGWYRLNSSNGSLSGTAFGILEDKPTPADYDGDGKTDISVYRPSTGAWYRLNSSNGSFAGIAFGISEDKPVAADYDGDAKAEIAVFRPSNGVWYFLSSINGAFSAQQFGLSEDRPTPNAFVY